jgi:hypothetical protein
MENLPEPKRKKGEKSKKIGRQERIAEFVQEEIV